MRTAGVLCVFLAFATLLASPVLRDPSGHVLGNINHPGLRGEMFHLSDFVANVRDGNFWHAFLSRQLAYPEGQDLREFAGFSLHLFFYLPFVMLGTIVSYNCLLLVTLALNGFCAYLLGRYLTRSFWPALLCGVMFLLGPYALLKLNMGFLQKLILWWIPLFMRDLLRFLDHPKKRHAVPAGAAWALMLLTYPPYAWYALWSALLLVALRLPKREFGTDRTTARVPALNGWPALVPAVAAFLLLLTSLPHGGRVPAGAGPEPLPFAVESAPNGSLDLLRVFRFHPYQSFMPQADYLALGLSILAVALAVVAVVRRCRHAVPLLAVLVFFLIVAVGPYPHTAGKIIARFPLPYYFFACHLPWGERLGFPIRALPFAEVALCALAALAVTKRAGRSAAPCSSASHLTGTGKDACPAAAWDGLPARPSARHVRLVLLLVLFTILERALFLPELFPAKTTSAELSPSLKWLRARGGVVLHLPFNIKGSDVRYYPYITARTGTRMMNRYLDPWNGFPVPPLPHPAPHEIRRYLARLRDAGCDLLVVHPDLVEAEVHPLLMSPGPPVERYSLQDTAVLARWCGEPVYSNATGLIVYRVPELETAVGRTSSPSLSPGKPGLEDRQGCLPHAEPDDVALLRYYDAHRDIFRRETQIRVHHFFVSLPAAATAAERLTASEEARRIHEKVDAGNESSFELAERLTRLDPLGRRWGDIGYIARGCLPEDVEAELFALEEIGTTIRMQRDDGIHIFRLMDIRPGRVYQFEEVRTAVRDAMIAERGDRQGSLRSPADMLFIPAGTFWMGSTGEEIDAACRMAERFVGRTRKVRREWFEDEEYRLVRVRAFCMDRHEVTVEEYGVFIEATGHSAPPQWQTGPPSDGRLPVTGVSFDDAQAYAAWIGKRLPTVEEWAWAARGAERRRFPWGNGPPDGTRANYADAETDVPWNDPEHSDGYAGPAPVGSYLAGATPHGLLDMAGNAREWTATAVLAIVDTSDNHIWSYSQRHLVPEDRRSRPVVMHYVRGGGWLNAADDLRCSDVRMTPPETRHEALGFRCVKDAGID